MASGPESRVFNGISIREIFAKRKRNEFRNFAKIKSIFAKFRVSRKCHFSENKPNETNETKRNAVKLCETKKTFKVREGKKQLYKFAHVESCLHPCCRQTSRGVLHHTAQYMYTACI